MSGGSGYDLGRDAICAALAQREHTGAVTLITDLVEEKIGGSARDHINKLYSAGKDYIASFSSIVFEAHLKGDKRQNLTRDIEVLSAMLLV